MMIFFIDMGGNFKVKLPTMELRIGKVPLKKGARGPGRPRTVPHIEGIYCPCSECRLDRARRKAEKAQVAEKQAKG
jgi:hypothetical protein